MHCRKVVIILVLCAMSVSVLAQKKKVTRTGSRTTRERSNYTTSKSRGGKIACPVFENSKYPYHGLGFKLGDPFAITYKYYHSKHLALAVDGGKAASGLYNHYFRDKMNEYQNFDTLSSQASVTYLSHRVKRDFIGEVKLLYHFDAKKISAGLQAYVGAGWEWKNTTIRYDYLYERPPQISNPTAEITPGTFQVSRSTQGPQVVVGIEYSYFKVPISAFMELEYFSDIQADRGWHNVEGGVGLRYVF